MKNTRGSEWNKWDLHIHTASSYDSPYKADDADELLCQALAENDIKAVAITDHFKIDKTRIEHLRKLAPEIVFFPGVELRTDKGANNLHLILIFSELSDLETLSADFNAIMLRTLAKSKESDETIYWQFDDIVEFCKNHGGLISIHAGKKSNGIDKEISNALPVKEAIKSDIAKHVDFFEVGKKKDIVDYYKYVFKEIDEKPIILCSDCHDPRKYSAKESLWIKANVTFEGLKQCIFQPSERVYVGTIPAAVDRVNKNKKANIDSLSVHRIIEPKNDGVSWFDFDISLNAGLVAVIGNKGSGKSAFSDIIGQVCKCRTMGSASFLNDNRFRKMPKNLASDYIAEIKWKDGHLERKGLDMEHFEKECFETEYGVSGIVREKKDSYEPIFIRGTAVGVVLCILAVIPTIIAGAMETYDYCCGLSVGLLLFILAIGVNLLIRVGMVKSSYDTLLQEGEYTKEEKLFKKKTDTFSGVYWCLTTAIYLAWSFWTMSWDITWIVWPVAGVLFAALLGVVKMVLKNGSETQHYI